MIDRARKFLAMAQRKKSLTQIADKFGVSKQLVSLELNKYFKEEFKAEKEKTYYRGKRKPAIPKKKFRCLNCGSLFIPSNRYLTYKFCGHKCNGEYVSKLWKTQKQKAGRA